MTNKCELSAVSTLYGNKVSHSQRKTRRSFLPNLRSVTLISNTTGLRYTFKVSASCIRTIDKIGGLDSYILKTKNEFLSKKAKKLKLLLSKKFKVESEKKYTS